MDRFSSSESRNRSQRNSSREINRSEAFKLPDDPSSALALKTEEASLVDRVRAAAFKEAGPLLWLNVRNRSQKQKEGITNFGAQGTRCMSEQTNQLVLLRRILRTNDMMQVENNDCLEMGGM
uniref:Uncharacterized protein n=1 Tax=Romanomermis culicivorax TaxID=13658 RepID=A0A915L1I2_ROMCU